MAKTVQAAIVTVISAGLLGASLIFSSTMTDYSKSSLVTTGNGSSAQVSTLSDFSALMKSCDSAYNSVEAMTTGGTGLSASTYADTDDTDNTKDVTSFSLEIATDSSLKYSSYSYYSQSSSSSSRSNSNSVSLTRTLQLAMDENACYYNSTGTLYISSKSSYSSNGDTESYSNKATYTFSIELLQTVKSVYMNIHKFGLILDGTSYDFPPDVLNQWIEFDSDSETAATIQSVTLYNLDIMDTISTYTEKYDSDNFAKTGSTYSMKKDYFKSFISSVAGSSLPDNITLSGDCDIDLATSTSPELDLYYKLTYSDSDSSSGNGASSRYSISYSGYEDSLFEFDNINNTIIQTDVTETDDVLFEEEFNAIMEKYWEDLSWLN